MDIEIKIPDIGSDAVVVIEVLVKIGDIVKKDDPLITVEGQKASMEIPSTNFGVVKSIFVKVGQTVKIGSLIALITLLKDDNQFKKKNNGCLNNKILKVKINRPDHELLEENNFKPELLVHATPVIRRLARQLNINLEKIVGSGRKGRITKEDIVSYTKQVLIRKERNFSMQSHLKNHVKDYSNKINNDTELHLTNIQKASGKKLSKSWSIIPHVTQFDESDITDLEKFRTKYNFELHKNNINSKLTILVFIMKVVAKSLKVFPKFNSVLCTDVKKKLILKKDINIGIAVDTKDGLLVPIINNVNNKDLAELSLELSLISKSARSGTLDISSMIGGSFTISNLGGIGGTGFTPIINYPEVAILGISQALIKPYWNEKKFEPRLMLPLSLSYDHRVIDGAEAVRFITFIKKMLSDIRLLTV
ncbi:MAG: 2-oxo acid dehydrogenase subunit E2 [Buchnera aphidicola (Floraphis choui)]